MQSEHWGVRIDHILTSIERIQEYTEGITFAEFKDYDLAVDAVIWRFQVIALASGHIPDDVIAQLDGVPWTTFRSFPIGLPSSCIDDDRLSDIWNAAKFELPALVPRLTAIRADAP